jgi:hypothetical protein
MPNFQITPGPSQTEQRFIRVEVHLDALIDEAHRFITMKWPRANPRESLGDLRYGYAILPIDILEQMVLAGVTQREDVAEFISSWFDPQHFDVR